VLENAKAYSPLSGITTNQSEGFNTVLKQYQQWKEVPIDSLVLGLYRLQMYYHNEVQRGYCGLGEYQLKLEFNSLLRPLDELLSKCIPPPEEIVSEIWNDTSKELTDAESQERPPDNSTDSTAIAPVSSQISRARYICIVKFCKICMNFNCVAEKLLQMERFLTMRNLVCSLWRELEEMLIVSAFFQRNHAPVLQAQLATT